MIFDYDSILFFQMILNHLDNKIRISSELWEDFDYNKLFIDIIVPGVLDTVISMSLNYPTNISYINIRIWSDIEISGILLVFVFECITLSIGLIRDEFVDIEESSMGVSIFQS
jgi:hypothetical protein